MPGRLGQVLSRSVYWNWHKSFSLFATKIAGFDPESDAHDARNAAVWHAAWVLVLSCAYVQATKLLPKELNNQMVSFREGRWPYAIDSQGGFLELR